MINTGLLLRRPFESDYSAYRRFLIANHTQDASSIRAGLAKKLLTPPGKRYSLPGLAQRWEQNYCHQYQIPYIPPVVLDQPRSYLRNCPTCARLGYHSYLFQYPWFRHCPMHHIPLADICPLCQRPWPLVSELQKTRSECSICGIHTSAQELVTLAGPRLSKGFEVLQALDHALKQYQTQDVQLVGVPWRHQDDMWRSANGPESLDWVSLVYPRPEGWEKTCASIGAPLQPVCVCRYPLNEPVTERAAVPGGASPNPSGILVDRAMTKRVLRGLTPVIKRLALTHQTTTTREREEFGNLSALSSHRDVYHISFNTWRTLFSLGSHEYSLPYARYFFKPEYVGVPSQPILMSEVNVSQVRLRIPETLSMWLYRAEFWRCYLSLVGHLQTLNNALRKRQTWRQYYNRLPEDAVPCRYDRIGLSLEPSLPHILIVVLLKRHAETTQSSLLSSLATHSRLHGSALLAREMNQCVFRRT